MAVGRHFENGFVAITQPGIILFQRNLSVQPQVALPRTVTRVKVPQFCKINMADGSHNENRFRLYLDDLLSD